MSRFPLTALSCALFFSALFLMGQGGPEIALNIQGGKVSADGVTVENTAGFAPGRTGEAIALDGNSTHLVKINIPKDRQFGKGSFSISAWMNPGKLSTAAKDNRTRVIGWDGWPAVYSVLDVRASGQVEFSSGYKSGEVSRAITLKSKGQLVEGKWALVTVVVDRGSSKGFIYLDGVLDSETPLDKAWSPDLTLDKPLTIGSSWQNFVGMVEGIQIYKRAVGAGEVAALVKGKLTAPENVGGASDPSALRFSFEEGAGKQTRESTTGLVGNLGAPWAAGWSGYGISMDGTPGQIMSLSIPPEKQIGEKSFTLTVRIRPTDLSVGGNDKRRRFVSLLEAWPAIWSVFDITSEGRPRFECGLDKKGFAHLAQKAIPLNSWTHMAFVFDRASGKSRWYIGGVLDSEQDLGTHRGLDLRSEKPFTVGSSYQNLTGGVDEVCLIPRVLSSVEIAAEAQSTPAKPPKEPRIVGPNGKVIEPRKENLKSASVYFVSPKGNDRFTGTLAEGNGVDGPFATLRGAFEMLRGLKARGPLSGPVTIVVKSGNYFLGDTFVFSPEDSGSESAPITVKAEEPGKAVFSGGRLISGWQLKNGLWQTTLPEVARGEQYFTALFIGGERATRARYPNTGFFRAETYVKESKDRFVYKEGDMKIWERLQDVTMTVYHSWTASVHTLDRLDTEKRQVVIKNPSSYVFGKWGQARYYLENAWEFLDQPGEWYLNRETGVLSYKPRPGEDLGRLEVIAPLLPRLFDFRGDADAGRVIGHLKFIGLSWQHVDSAFGDTEVIDGQAFAKVRRATIFAKGLQNTRFEQCEISHGQVHGIWFEVGCSGNTVRQCHIWDLGGGGVYIGDTALPKSDEVGTHHITVENNFIHRVNLVMHGAHGIWIGKGTHNTLTHNEICDLDYSPIGVGWTWGFAEPSGAHHNIITYNYLHDFGLGELSDMAGIYTLGVSPGTEVRFNKVHDAWAYSYGGWGLYTDEGSTEVLMEKNLVYNTKSGGFHQHYGSNNTIRNNIFAFASEGNVISMRGDEKNRSFHFKNNIVLTTNGFMVNTGFRSPAFTMEKNMYWDLTDPSTNYMSFNGMTFLDWQEAKGYDKSSKVMDPRMADPRGFDFRFRDPSAVKAMGFEPFEGEIAKAGLTGPSTWTTLPKKFTPRAKNPDVIPPNPKIAVGSRWKLGEDFESVAPGVPTSLGSSDPGVLVTAERSFKSTHSLKFQDESTLSKPWQPHLAIKKSFGAGVFEMEFDLFLEENIQFWLEGRETVGSPYRVGPSLEVMGDGSLVIGKKEMGRLPANKWIHLKIRTPQGDGIPSTGWDLITQVEGENPVAYSNLSHGNPSWGGMEQIIFSANGEKKASFFLDNLKVEVKKK